MQFESELTNDKFYFSKGFILFIIALILGIVAFEAELTETNKIVVLAISCVILIISFFSYTKTKLKVADDYFIIEKTSFGRLRTKKYQLSKIEDVEYLKNVKSRIYFSFGQVKVMGADVTPESMKNYYYHKEIISFMYEGKYVIIGRWKKEFNAKKLFSILKQRKKLK